MKRLCAGLVLAGMLVAGGARADEKTMTVQNLFEQCKGSVGSAGYMYCMGYVAGQADWMFTNGESLKQLPPKDANLYKFLSMCGQTTYGAEQQVFMNWAQAHPEFWTIDASFGVAAALRETWPCP